MAKSKICIYSVDCVSYREYPTWDAAASTCAAATARGESDGAMDTFIRAIAFDF